MNDHKELNKILGRLARSKDFTEYLVIIREMREDALRGMQDASTERLHQIAGAVVVYNAILDNAACYKLLADRDSKQS